MKKWIACLLCLTLALSLAACGEKPAAPAAEPESAAEPAVPAEAAPAETPAPAAAAPDDGKIRILGVGNSWMRDSLRWLSSIAHDAGKDVIVGHAYLGGSTLENQYFGLHNSTYTYRHDSVDQAVHGTYQYWKYSGGGKNPVKTPSSGYNNGYAGIGVTLESVVGDEPWDYIVFLGPYSSAGSMTGWTDTESTVVCDGTWKGDTVGETIHWDIAAFLDDLVSLLPEGTKPPVIGMEVPWVPAMGNTSKVSQTVADVYNGGTIPEDQAGRDAVYATAQQMIQKTAAELKTYLGDKCVFTANTGLAMWMARQQEELLGFGYKLQRAKNNTHLAEGMPMFLASMTLADAILGIAPQDFTWFPTMTVDNAYSKETDLGASTDETKIKPTAEMAETLKQIAVEANRAPLG